MVKLLIPGPVPLTEAVQEALAAPVRTHYGEDWTAIWDDVIDMVRRLFGTDGEVINLVGSGSSGLDAALGSIISPGDRVLVSVNGFHGDRLSQMARAHHADVIRVDAPWGSPVRASDFAQALDGIDDPKLIVATHVETTTGVINPVAEIAEVARKAGALMLVDAVASLGGVVFKMDAWGIDVACTASQKCLNAPAGLAQVALNSRAWETISNRADVPRSWYLDLLTWQDYARRWAAWHPFPVTVPTGTVSGLHAALRALIADTVEQRADYYVSLRDRLRAGAREIGFDLLVEDEWAAPVVTAIAMPPGLDSARLVEFLYQSFDVKVGSGFGPLQSRVIRVGHMSPQVTEADIELVLSGMRAFLKAEGA